MKDLGNHKSSLGVHYVLDFVLSASDASSHQALTKMLQCIYSCEYFICGRMEAQRGEDMS